MANIKVHYLLSVWGQKVVLLAGGSNGGSQQTLLVEQADPAFAGLLALATVNADGQAYLECLSPLVDPACKLWTLAVPASRWDYIPSALDILRAETDRRTVAAERAAEAERKVREDTSAVLAERRVCRHNDSVTATVDSCHGLATYEWCEPAWPYPCDESIRSSNQALLWAGELAAMKQADMGVAQLTAEDKAREAAQKKKDAAEARRLERERQDLEEGDVALRCEDGALMEAPVWESHKRGKNWLALIALAPTQPGGLARDFAQKARGDAMYILPSLRPGDAIEFGADYYSAKGRPSKDRWYGFVVRVEDALLVVRKCAAGREAVNRGRVFAGRSDAEHV